jgi:hypothetical protein
MITIILMKKKKCIIAGVLKVLGMYRNVMAAHLRIMSSCQLPNERGNKNQWRKVRKIA